jgi:hypothetical protein
MKEEIGKWVVCHGMLGGVYVYGKVLSSSELSVTIDDKIGGWDSNVWDRNYVKFFDTEEKAKEYYREHRSHDDSRWLS